MRGQLPLLVVTGVAALTLAGLAPLASLVSGGSITTMELLSDPAELTDTPWYLGGVSALNVLVWIAAATAYLLGALGLRLSDPRLAGTFGALGALTVVLALDDHFLLHEIAIPWIVGAPEEVTFAAYLALAVAITWWGRTTLVARPEITFYVLAAVAFVASAGLDVAGWDSTARRVAEETFKTIGTVAWLAFPGAVVVRTLLASDGRPAASRADRVDPAGAGP